MNLKSKVAVVTSAASDIVRGITRIFCRSGAKVVIADLNQAGAAAAAELGDVDSAIGTDETQVDAGMAMAVAALGYRHAGQQRRHPPGQRIERSGRQKRAFVVSGSHACSRVACLRWSDFELGWIDQRLGIRGVGKSRAVPCKRNPL
jgi:NAD(P)-dependent dehydrogenase (short-subunit alcohol dehydrogenase family)